MVQPRFPGVGDESRLGQMQAIQNASIEREAQFSRSQVLQMLGIGADFTSGVLGRRAQASESGLERQFEEEQQGRLFGAQTDAASLLRTQEVDAAELARQEFLGDRRFEVGREDTAEEVRVTELERRERLAADILLAKIGREGARDQFARDESTTTAANRVIDLRRQEDFRADDVQARERTETREAAEGVAKGDLARDRFELEKEGQEFDLGPTSRSQVIENMLKQFEPGEVLKIIESGAIDQLMQAMQAVQTAVGAAPGAPPVAPVSPSAASGQRAAGLRQRASTIPGRQLIPTGRGLSDFTPALKRAPSIEERRRAHIERIFRENP